MASQSPNSVRKFEFGERFDEPELRPDGPPPPKYDETELAAARDAGRIEGMAQGQVAAEASLTAQIAASVDKIGIAIAHLLADREHLHQELAAHSIRTVLAVLQRTVPELAHRHMTIEIEGLVRTCLTELYDEPRVVVRAPDALIDSLQENIDRIAAACGFTGKVALFGDPAMAATDCRVEWADGGAERSFDATWREIENAINRGLNSTASSANQGSTQL